MTQSLAIVENGRDGQVRYLGPGGSIDGYWEFGGGDVVTIVSMGSRDEWTPSHAWALHERTNILRFVAAEVIRQRAPSCVAEIDEERGVILLRTGTGKAPEAPPADAGPKAASARFVQRYAGVRSTFAILILAAAAMAGALMWIGKQTLTVAQGNGVPLNDCARFEGPGSGGIACLIQKTDPHLPNWTGRGGGETTSVSILLLPLDGAQPRQIPVAQGLSPNSLGLARILGSDGVNLWFDVVGLYGVRLRDGALLEPKDLAHANPSLETGWWDDQRGMDVLDGRLHVVRSDRSAALDVDPETLIATSVQPKSSNERRLRRELWDHLSAGLIVAPDTWLGLHSEAELAGPYKPGKWIKSVEDSDRETALRRLSKATLEPSQDGKRFRIRKIARLGDNEYLNAAFLRSDNKSAPILLSGPDGAIMMHTSSPGREGTAVVSRVDVQGQVVWSTDTGLDRFELRQILPGLDAVAFVGTKPAQPDKLPEPLVVLIATASGQSNSHTLWR